MKTNFQISSLKTGSFWKEIQISGEVRALHWNQSSKLAVCSELLFYKKYLKKLIVTEAFVLSSDLALSFKDCMDAIVQPVCYMMDTFVEEEKIPNFSKETHVIPVFKKSDSEKN